MNEAKEVTKVVRVWGPPSTALARDRRGPMTLISAALAVVAAMMAWSPTATAAAASPKWVQRWQSSQSNVMGPGRLSPARFPHPTKRGSLLVAAVLCGVVHDGMEVPALFLSSRWRRAEQRIGGIQGGLEAALFYYPDNPGGITSVPLDAGDAPNVASGSNAWCTTFLWEVSGVGTHNTLDAVGSASYVQGQQRNTIPLSVETTRPTQHHNDLVVMAETDGSEVPTQHLYTVLPPFTLQSHWDDGHVYQPGTMSSTVMRNKRTATGTISQWSYWWDASLVIAAFTT
jgi:hypothetical protein